MLNGRKSLVTLIATSAAAAVTFVGTIPSGTAEAKPTIQDVQHRVDRLYHAAEQASERYNAIRVQLKADASNARSREAIARLGATYEGTLRDCRIRPDGEPRGISYFSILAREWPDVRAGLQRSANRTPTSG